MSREIAGAIEGAAMSRIPKLAYSIEEAAFACGVSVSTIDHAIRRGEIKPLKRGRRYIINHVQLERWVGLCHSSRNTGKAGG